MIFYDILTIIVCIIVCFIRRNIFKKQTYFEIYFQPKIFRKNAYYFQNLLKIIKQNLCITCRCWTGSGSSNSIGFSGFLSDAGCLRDDASIAYNNGAAHNPTYTQSITWNDIYFEFFFFEFFISNFFFSCEKFKIFCCNLFFTRPCESM